MRVTARRCARNAAKHASQRRLIFVASLPQLDTYRPSLRAHSACIAACESFLLRHVRPRRCRTAQLGVNCMRRQAQSLVHKLRSAMAPAPVSGPRVHLATAPRELATNGVRPRGAPTSHGARRAARRAACSARAEAHANSFAAPPSRLGLHVSGGLPLALQARGPGSARPLSTLAAISSPAAETAAVDAPADEAPPDVKVVDNLADAKDVVRRLLALKDTGCPLYHAVDTEVCIRPRRGPQPRRSRARHAMPLPRCLKST